MGAGRQTLNAALIVLLLVLVLDHRDSRTKDENEDEMGTSNPG
jgi:hypothetical protein